MMKTLLAWLVCAVPALGQPFTVENKIAAAPQFVVVNRIAPLAFTAGPAAPAALPAIDFDLSALAPAPAVAVPVQPFRGIERRDSHACPICGRIVLAKAGPGPIAGTHTHRCPVDGATWFHDNK